MNELESSLHLFQPPLYRGQNGSWLKSYTDAIGTCSTNVTWDPAAILSILSFNYPCGNRTLLNEVKRRPWMSKIGLDRRPQLESIPPHGRLWKKPIEIAEKLGELLCREAIRVCQGRKEIYLLLSGGLDSRVVAGILSRLFKEGRLETKPIGITWGLEDSRDVVYARAVTEILGFEWKHINIGPETIVQNIMHGSNIIGCLVPPLDLHAMMWFESAPKDALVLAGSYGDSVGRAEFSGKHLVELSYLQPVNTFGLIRQEILSDAYTGLKADLKSLHDRTPNVPKYVHCEHDMQGHYMRGMIAHVMTIINRYCSLYQMFTDPEVYGYMWSIHPSVRDDRIYAALLTQLDQRLARLPWARTNKALRGVTEGANKELQRRFHRYVEWIRGPVCNELGDYVSANWFAETGIFDPRRIEALNVKITQDENKFGLYCNKAYGIWTWLAAFRRFSEQLNELGKISHIDNNCDANQPSYHIPEGRNKIKQFLISSAVLHKISKRFRRFILKLWILLKYPPSGKFSP